MKKNLLKITIITVLLVLIYTTIVNALSFTVVMTPSNTNVKESEEFTVKFKVSNLDVGNGINALSGVLNYDSEIFENISDSSIDALSNWSVSYNKDNKKITLTQLNYVKEEEDIFQITFITKSGASGTGKISLTSIVASNSESEITASDISTSITVGSSDKSTNETSNKETTNTQNVPIISVTNTQKNNTANQSTNTNVLKNNTTNNVVNNSVQNTNQNNVVSSYVNTSATSSKEDIPHTGVEDTILYIIGAVIVAALVFYIKFEKINKDMK